jgi:hypothetical protein
LETGKKEDRRVAKTVYRNSQWTGAYADFKLSRRPRFYHHSPKVLSSQTRHSPPRAILTKFSTLPDDTILKFLKMMVDKKLMFAEENKYLSLAVPVRSKNLR